MYAFLLNSMIGDSPLDVVVNKPFKGYMQQEWADFISEPKSEKDYTSGGNLKKPSYERLLRMVSNSVERLNQKPEMIKKVKGFLWVYF